MVAYVQILPSACLAGYENDGYANKYLTRAKTIPPHTRAIFFFYFFIATYQIFSPRLFCGSFARDILLSRFPIFWQRACSQSIILFVKSHSVSPLDSLKKKKTKQNKTKNNNNNTNNGDSRFDCKIRKSWYEKMLPLNRISTWSWKCLMEGRLFYNLGVKSRA